MVDVTTSLVFRDVGLADYETVWHAMQQFTDERTEHDADELWFVEHPAVFTQGQAGKEEHLLMPGDIPVVKVDRGGQVTYHGPGQQVVYVLINLKRRKIGVRQLVTLIEQAIVSCLAQFGITSFAKADAPGVYINDNAKIASLGLRVRKGCSFHGLALNVDMDLSPFLRINPCGYAGMQMVDMKQFNASATLAHVQQAFEQIFTEALAASTICRKTGLE